MDSIGTALTPSRVINAAPKRKRRPPQDRVDQLAARYAAGLDFWTGRPLTGSDREDWRLLQEIAAALPTSAGASHCYALHAAVALA